VIEASVWDMPSTIHNPKYRNSKLVELLAVITKE
jgi:hypothetical protein